MRILVSGAAGFVGSNLADRLIAEGHEVWGIDNLETGRLENVNVNDVVDFVEEDVRWLHQVSRPKCDLIIHCAASYKNHEAWEHDAHTNVIGAQVVAREAQRVNARIFYFQTVLPPISSYAISKIAGEHYLRLSGQPLTVFRLASIYGPRNISGAIPTFYRQIKAGEPCTVVHDVTRDFVFIEDLVERVSQEVQFGHKSWSDVMDVRTGSETRISDIPNMIGEMLGLEATMKLIPKPENDVPHYDMNGTPRAGIPFAQGLAKTVAWYEEHGVGDTYSHLSLKKS